MRDVVAGFARVFEQRPVHRRDADPEIDLLALNTEKNAKKVSEFLKLENISLPIAFDKEREFRKTFELFSVPSWVVLTKNKLGQKYVFMIYNTL